MMQILEANRAAFSHSKLIHATAAKIYADGVLEGNPYADPPTLPNAAMLQPYLQPRFHYDLETGKAGCSWAMWIPPAHCARKPGPI